MPQLPPSTRWCPTPEQLMILEEMYRSGIRTPNASHIQQITAHLSYYGKIEGKNVFYWFQNHKARDRQKLRRRLNRHQLMLQQHYQSNPQLHHLPNQAPLHFLQQGLYQEATQTMNLVGNLVRRDLETCEREEIEKPMATTTSPACYGFEWMTMTGESLTVPPCCKPLKTLELFPTKSTGLKEECSTSKSSSCSTSATN